MIIAYFRTKSKKNFAARFTFFDIFLLFLIFYKIVEDALDK